MTISLLAKKRKLNLTALDNDVWLVERDQVMVEGEVLTFSVKIVGATSVSSPSSNVYVNGGDPYTACQSGSDSVSSNVIVLQTITAQSNDGGKEYVVVISATVDGSTKVWKFKIRIVKPSSSDILGEFYKDIFVTKPDQSALEGATLAYTLTFIGATIVSGVVSTVYKNNADYSSTVQGGSDSESGNVATLQTITTQSGDEGTIYVVVVKATVDGNTEIRKFLIWVADPKEAN